MKDYIETRVKEVANYIIDAKTTIRGAAEVFGVCKSTVHKDLNERLPIIDPVKAAKAHSILKVNKAEKHIRGGIATRNKYRGLI